MVERDDTFRASKMFEALESLPKKCCQIVGLVRPHSEHAHIIQVAHPANPDDWHDLDEGAVAGFVPLQSTQSPENRPKMVRLYLNEEHDHPLALSADHSSREAERTIETLGQTNATSVLSAGAQYCYYDALGRYVCIPI